jgi:glycosyltransferase involved in cell wall biosynthesis
MMKKNLLVLYAKNPHEVFNIQSALGSYVFCLSRLMQSDGKLEVFINGCPVKQADKQSEPEGNSKIQSGIKFKNLIPDFIKSIIKDLILFRNLNKLYKKINRDFNYDLILEICSYGSDIGARLSEKHKVPLFTIFDSPATEEFAYLNNYIPTFKSIIDKREKYTLSASEKIVVYSLPVRKHLENKYRLMKNNFYYHQNVDFDRLTILNNKIKNNEIVFGFIGSFLKWHRVECLIEAFENLRKEGYMARLILLGTGMEFDKIKEIVKNSPYKEDIELPGYVTGEALVNYKKRMDIGIMPGSNWYGAPNKIFEYGACKMGVIAPDTPTISYLFTNNKDIFLFEENDHFGLMKKMVFCIENREKVSLISNDLHNKIVEKYNPEETIRFYNKLFET